MLRKTLFALFICFTVQTVLAQTKLQENMFFRKLANGLDLLVIEDSSVPLVTIEITVKNGSYTETPEFNGLSHLYEHMFFKANKDYPSQEKFLDRVSELGMSFNGSTSEEKVNYYFTLPTFNLKSGLEFMNSAIRYPLFDAEEMKKENIVVDGEFQRQESNPFFALTNENSKYMWGQLYSRKNAIGDHNVLRNATPALMDSIKNKYYWPNNSLLTVAGDVNHNDVFAKVDGIFGNWKTSPFDPFNKWPIPEFKPLEKSDYFIAESELTNVPVIMFSWFGPDTRTDIPATYAADVFSFILNQNSSKLSQSLIDAGLALQFDIGYLTLKHVGPISLIVVPHPSKVKECLAEMKKQIALWDTEDYVTNEQIEVAKRKLEIKLIQEQEITSDFVQTLSFWWASASLDYFTTYGENLRKVQKSDLQSYVRKYIKNKPHTAGMLINPAMKRQINPETFFKAN
jgi:zinc protease